MGFEYDNTDKNNVVYLEVKYQGLIQKLKEPADGSQSLEVTNPKTQEKKVVNFRSFRGVTGMINGLKWYEYDSNGGGGAKNSPKLMGYKLSLLVDDENSPTGFTTAVFDMPLKGIAFNTFTKVAENIDSEKPLTISVWHNKEKDKTVVQFKQDNQTVKYKYTKDNMGDCPVAEYNQLTGYDFSKQVVYLKSRIDDLVMPKFNQPRNSSFVNNNYVDNVENRGYSSVVADEDGGYDGNVMEEGDITFDVTELGDVRY